MRPPVELRVHIRMLIPHHLLSTFWRSPVHRPPTAPIFVPELRKHIKDTPHSPPSTQ